MKANPFTIAVIIPCYNEAEAITQVIQDFRKSLPDAKIYVFDNNSTDDTKNIANTAGAQVFSVPLKGKGNVVRRMFADIESDVYILVDGDSTYDAHSAQNLIDKLICDKLDMVVGCRVDLGQTDSYRLGHRFGNKMLTTTVRLIFGGHFSDMLSGYRAFSRRYVKSFPALSKGFETETELTVHALELRMPYGEVFTPYGSRPEGSESKLSTIKDGIKILKTIFRLYMAERPFEFFGFFAFILCLSSVAIAFPLFIEYLHTGLVPRFPTAILSVGLMLSGFISVVCGIILDNVTRARHEIRRLAYLAIPRITL